MYGHWGEIGQLFGYQFLGAAWSCSEVLGGARRCSGLLGAAQSCLWPVCSVEQAINAGSR